MTVPEALLRLAGRLTDTAAELEEVAGTASDDLTWILPMEAKKARELGVSLAKLADLEERYETGRRRKAEGA